MRRSPSPQDHLEVLALLAAVKYAKEDEDEVRFAACWAEHARLEIQSNGKPIASIQGRDAIIAFYQQVWEKGGHGKGSTRETHIAEHPDVALLDEGRLLARHTASFFYADDGAILIKGFGRFRDIIAFEDGAWRIIERQAFLERGN